jgi:hypothetical protein
MTGIKLARTQYCEGYWLRWETGFNEGLKALPSISIGGEELKNDIQVILENEQGDILGDAICHYGSYGVKDGQWEIMIDSIPKSFGDSVMGYLTFKEVLKYFDKKIRSDSTPAKGEQKEGAKGK